MTDTSKKPIDPLKGPELPLPNRPGTNALYKDRSPQNLEKYFDLVEGLQKEDLDFEEGAGKFDEPRPMVSAPNDTLELRDLPEKARTPLRLKYEAQIEVIKRQNGDLEAIRSRLGLSRRKMSQLLLVDPSAWSRWVRAGAPPHIYRALEWYLLLQKEAPAQAHSYWIATVQGGQKQRESSTEVSAIQLRVQELESQLKRLRRFLLGSLVLVFILSVLIFLSR